MRRLGLLVFGALFLVLFVVLAIAEGLGDPSIPEGDVALVEDAPGDLGEVTKARFDHALELAAVQAGEEKVPKPDDPRYDDLTETAMNSFLEGIWIQGLAGQRSIGVSDQEVAAELRKVKKANFPTEADFKTFLKESHYTPADVNERVRIQVLSEKLQEQLKEKVPQPSQSEIENYYEAAKATQFTQTPSADVRLIVNKDEQKAEEAKEALVDDNTAKNWSKVAKKYSEDVVTKEKGGLQRGLQEGVSEEPLDAALFDTPEGQVEGPLDTQRGYTVFEVVNSVPGGAQELKDVEDQIKSTLAQQLEQEYFTSFVAGFRGEWTQRTFCASDFVTEYCANYEGNGHPPTAPPACYETDPKGGRPEACPAPVFQLVPALPGSVTPLAPQGNPLAQRPRPAAGNSEAGEAAAGAEVIPAE